jgi:hypothetical protein
MARYLGPHFVLSLAEVIQAVVKGSRVRWEHNGQLVEGTPRGFTADQGMTSSIAPDIRDAYIRVTTTGAYDLWIKVEDAVILHQDGAFAL